MANLGGQDGADHAVFVNGAPQFTHGRRHILQRENGNALQSRFVPQEAIVEIIIVGAAQIDGKVGHADLADVHETGRIDHRRFDIALFEGELPILQRGNQKRRARAAIAGLPVPSVVRQQGKVEHCVAPFFVMLRQILENVAFDFTDVTVRIDHLPISHVFS